MNQPIPIELQRLRFEYGEMPNPGMEALYAFYPQYSTPLGLVWYAQTLNGLVDIHHVYVHERAREQGIATAMLKRLWAWYPTCSLCTASVNEFSEGLLVKLKFERERDGWFLRRQSEVCPMI